jgi:hypothetical protein
MAERAPVRFVRVLESPVGASEMRREDRFQVHHLESGRTPAFDEITPNSAGKRQRRRFTAARVVDSRP